MARSGGILQRLAEEAETRFGLKVVDRGELSALQERNFELQAFADEAEELAYHSLSYFSGRPSELQPEARNRLAQRSRIALMEDPLAGAEADLLANFAFGQGVQVPQAEDEKVQEIIEEAWTDPVNEEKLTGFEAQRHRSNELLTQANLYPVAYVRNGYVRVGFLDADLVQFIVCDPEDEERPLYYGNAKRRVEWDFVNDRAMTVDEMNKDGRPRIVYYPHWRNVEDMEVEAEDSGGEKPPVVPDGKLGEGLVYHARINRIGRTQFGTPPWARTLRFFKAMDDVTQSHVVMAQAASTFIAKRVMSGTPDSIRKSANNILAQTGELGAARFGEAERGPDPHRQPAAAPGSFWLENESNRLEAMQLNSGAGQVAQTAQIVRAPISAASSFGQHYLGDASNANLATATSLELPTLMAVQAWQQTTKGVLEWFTEIVVQEAVRAGRLGGFKAVLSEEECHVLGIPKHVAAKPLNELRLRETFDRAEAERRTGRKLDFTIAMPYPGRRNLPDVVSMVGTVAAAFDPSGVNVELRRELLMFLATHGMQLDDPKGFVDRVLPEDQQGELMPGLDPATNAPYVDTRSQDYVPPQYDDLGNQIPGTGTGAPGSGSGSGASAGSSGSTSGGGGGTGPDKAPSAKKGRKPPSRTMGGGPSVKEALRELEISSGGLFRSTVIDPLLPDRNGHGR